MAGLSEDEKQRRLDVLREGVREVCAAVERAGTAYGARFRKNGGVSAILEEAAERLAKPGRRTQEAAS